MTDKEFEEFESQLRKLIPNFLEDNADLVLKMKANKLEIGAKINEMLGGLDFVLLGISRKGAVGSISTIEDDKLKALIHAFNENLKQGGL